VLTGSKLADSGSAGLNLNDGEVRRLRGLLEIQAITDVLVSYCELLDRMDLEALSALFTEDCQVDYGPDSHLRSCGSTELRADLARMWRWRRTSHHLSNIAVRLADDHQHADATSAVLAWHERPDGSTATMMGRYLDRLTREGARWQISARRQVLTGNDAGFDVNINVFERLHRPSGA